MINKQSLWFVTLFSLIVILSIYYFKGGETPLSIAKLTNEDVTKGIQDKSNSLDVLKITNDEATISKIDELQKILLDDEATLEEKNNAFDLIEVIADERKRENEISNLIKKEFSYENFVKINDNNIKVTLFADVHNNEIANNVIRRVNEYTNNLKYVTVKFDTK